MDIQDKCRIKINSDIKIIAPLKKIVENSDIKIDFLKICSVYDRKEKL